MQKKENENPNALKEKRIVPLFIAVWVGVKRRRSGCAGGLNEICYSKIHGEEYEERSEMDSAVRNKQTLKPFPNETNILKP